MKGCLFLVSSLRTGVHTNNKTQVQLRFFLFLLLVLFGFFPPSERERERGRVTSAQPNSGICPMQV